MKKALLLLISFFLFFTVFAQTEFITTWKTDNTGTSNDNQITIPTFGSETYSYGVDWGDGNTDVSVTGNITHTYASAGTYTVEITGTFPRIFFNNGGDKEKIVSIEQWGTITWSSMEEAFYGCTNLTSDASDKPDLSSVTNFGSMYSGASSFNGGGAEFENWDTGDAVNMTSMFQNAISFNRNIGNWVIGNVVAMGNMFDGVTLSTGNYDAILIGWYAQTVQSGVTFDAGNSKYCAGQEAHDLLFASNSWTITDGGSDCSGAYITTWKTDNTGTSNDDQISIPTNNGLTYNYSVNWGDGNADAGVFGDITHTYATAGTYTVKITGDFPSIYFNYGGDIDKFLTVEQWGTQNWQSFNASFAGCSNLVINATDNPDLSSVTDMSSAFSTSSFNQDVTAWDVSNVTNMGAMFSGSSFNQDISGWDVSGVTNMKSMFSSSSFNQDISGWDVSIVSDMSYMFYNNNSFNQSLNSWNTSGVNNMEWMFYSSSYNQDISAWDVSGVNNMSRMFQDASSFNQDISNWNVTGVGNMYLLFYGASSFNGDISSWDVSDVTNMYGMFYDAISFNQDISAWDVSGVTNMTDMFLNVTLSTQNYDALLNGWATQTVQNGIAFSGGNSQYSCVGEDARASLIADDSWTITDGDFIAGVPVPISQVTDVVFDTPTTSTIPVESWTVPSGGATGYAVYINSADSWTVPTDEPEPTADLVWANTGQQCIYFGTSSNPDVTVTNLNEETTYYFKIYAYNACSGTETYETTGTSANVTTASTVGIKVLNKKISIFPNPSNGMFVMEVDEIYNLEITDLSGKRILSQKLINSKNTIELNQKGIFLLRLTNNKGTINHKIIVTD